MATFEFIASEELRESLEKDTEELVSCMEARAWKAAEVLAGSVIQATLVDYLSSSGKVAESELLAMSFAELLSFAKDLQILTPRTVDLASSISSYLQLIHPSKRVRLQEAASENGARIAQALLEIVVNEIASRRQDVYGATAEQIVSKLASDPSSISIIDHILRKTGQHELRRLLLEVIPRAYIDAAQMPSGDTQATLKRLQYCYRQALELASEEVKQRAARKFVSVLEEESEFAVHCHETAFFRGSDLRFLAEDERTVVKAHFFASLGKGVTMPLLEAAAGMGGFLDSEAEARAFFVPLAMRLLDENDAEMRSAITGRFLDEYHVTSEHHRRVILSWIGRLKRFFEQAGRREAVEAVEELEAGM